VIDVFAQNVHRVFPRVSSELFTLLSQSNRPWWDVYRKELAQGEEKEKERGREREKERERDYILPFISEKKAPLFPGAVSTAQWMIVFAPSYVDLPLKSVS
jgi:hypothetical protein